MEHDSVCPYCSKVNELATVISSEYDLAPSSGDVSICIECANISIFGEDGKLRKPLQQDMNRITKDEQRWKAIQSYRAGILYARLFTLERSLN